MKRKQEQSDDFVCSSINNYPATFLCSGKLLWGNIFAINEATTNKNCVSAQQGEWLVEEKFISDTSKIFVAHDCNVNGNELIESCLNQNSITHTNKNIVEINRQDWYKNSNKQIFNREGLKKKQKTDLQTSDLLLPNGFMLVDSENYELFLDGIVNSEFREENGCWLFGDKEKSFGVHLTTKMNSRFFYEKKAWMVINTTTYENITSNRVIGFVYLISFKKVGLCDLSIVTCNKGNSTTEDFSPSIIFPSIRSALKFQKRIITSYNLREQTRNDYYCRITYHYFVN